MCCVYICKVQAECEDAWGNKTKKRKKKRRKKKSHGRFIVDGTRKLYSCSFSCLGKSAWNRSMMWLTASLARMIGLMALCGRPEWPILPCAVSDHVVVPAVPAQGIESALERGGGIRVFVVVKRFVWDMLGLVKRQGKAEERKKNENENEKKKKLKSDREAAT
jgi:hypothetical protein